MRRETPVSVIDAQMQPELGARREHAVRLVGPLGDQVVDQDAGVALGAVQRERRLALELQRRVDSRHDALAGSLFVAAGPVDLPGEIQPLACSSPAASGPVPWDRWRRTRSRIPAAASRPSRGPGSSAPSALHLHRQRSGHAVDVDLVRVQSLRLEKELVLRLVGELDDLVLDRRAIARPDALDLPGIHRRAVDVLADQPQRLRRGERDVAAHLRAAARSSSCRKLNGVGSASPGCSSKRAQSIVRPSSRGGVPVFRRHSRSPRLLQASPSRTLRRLAAAARRCTAVRRNGSARSETFRS